MWNPWIRVGCTGNLGNPTLSHKDDKCLKAKMSPNDQYPTRAVGVLFTWFPTQITAVGLTEEGLLGETVLSQAPESSFLVTLPLKVSAVSQQKTTVLSSAELGLKRENNHGLCQNLLFP